MTQNRKLLIGVGTLLLLVAGLFVVMNANPDDEPTVTQVNTSDDDEQPVSPGDEESDVSTDEAAEEPETPKRPQLSGNVTEKPIIASSFGLVAESPVPRGQTVSTSCTTIPNVECLAEFTNVDSGDVIQFEVKQSSSNGVAIWEWQGGEDIPSGTWESQVFAGDQESEVEVVYVQ